jgi:DNA-binding NarL/FixJ family response regulator
MDPATEPNPSTPDGEHRARVLIVDDHALVRGALLELIDAQPDLKTCAEAATIDEAERAILTYEPDVVILDLTLSREDGRELLKRLAQRPNPPPVLVLSMLEEALYATELLALGARGFLNKSCPPAEILTALRSVLAGRVALSGAATERLVKRLAKGRETRGSALNAAMRADTERLTPREREVLGLIGRAHSTREIADALGCAPKTVDSHKRAICEKLGLDTTDVLLRYAIAHHEEQGGVACESAGGAAAESAAASAVRLG